MDRIILAQMLIYGKEATTQIENSVPYYSVSKWSSNTKIDVYKRQPLPSELAKLLDLELEAIKRQGARPKNDKEAEALGKLSVEIVGKEHDMNYKKAVSYTHLHQAISASAERNIFFSKRG